MPRLPLFWEAQFWEARHRPPQPTAAEPRHPAPPVAAAPRPPVPPRRDRAPGRPAGPGPPRALRRAVDEAGRLRPQRPQKPFVRTYRGACSPHAQHGPPGDRRGLPKLPPAVAAPDGTRPIRELRPEPSRRRPGRTPVGRASPPGRDPPDPDPARRPAGP